MERSHESRHKSQDSENRKRKHSKSGGRKSSKGSKFSPVPKKEPKKSKYYSSTSDTYDSSSESSSSSLGSSPPKHRKRKSKKIKSVDLKKHKSKHKKDDSFISPPPKRKSRKLKSADLKKHKSKHKKVKKDKKIKPSDQPISPIATSSAILTPQEPQPPSTDIKAVLAAQSAKMKGPMTKEDYEKQQSVVRRVYDPDTGRHRLVKGDGEIIEEIVSKERHKAINKQATLGDGSSFQAQTRSLL